MIHDDGRRSWHTPIAHGHDRRDRLDWSPSSTQDAARSGVDRKQDPERDRSHERQDPEQAHHARQATWGPVSHGPAGRTDGASPEVRPTDADVAGPVVGPPAPAAILRPSSTPAGWPANQEVSDRACRRIGRPVRRPSDQTTAIRRTSAARRREMSIRPSLASARRGFGAPLLASRRRSLRRADARRRDGALMPATVIVGLQWGDEGKGKTTDFLAEQVAMVVRYQGGDNAGHTVVSGDEVFKLRLTPSGVLYPHITSVIGNGVVVNPVTLIDELDMLALARASTSSRVRVSRSAHVIMPYHVALDRANEARLGGGKVGTTGRGIGPTYGDRAWRLGLRMEDLLDRDVLRERIARALPDKNLLLAAMGGPTLRGRRRSSRRRSPGASGCATTSTTRPGWSRRRWPAASTSCSRAPRARCSTSTTAAIRS